MFAPRVQGVRLPVVEALGERGEKFRELIESFGRKFVSELDKLFAHHALQGRF